MRVQSKIFSGSPFLQVLKTIKTCFNYNDNDNDLDDEDQETTTSVQMKIENIANESISAATDVILTVYPEDLRIRLGLD